MKNTAEILANWLAGVFVWKAVFFDRKLTERAQSYCYFLSIHKSSLKL